MRSLEKDYGRVELRSARTGYREGRPERTGSKTKIEERRCAAIFLPMLNGPFQVEIGPYWLLLPGDTSISADVTGPTPGAYQMALTKWVVLLGRFQFFIHLDPIRDLSGLKSFIDYTTKGDVTTPLITVNGVPGVRYGDYGPPRTWMDWWFK